MVSLTMCTDRIRFICETYFFSGVLRGTEFHKTLCSLSELRFLLKQVEFKIIFEPAEIPRFAREKY